MNKLVENEKVVPVIDKQYSLDEITEAMKYMENSHPKGKVSINMIK